MVKHTCLSVFGHLVGLALKGLKLAFVWLVLHEIGTMQILVLSTKKPYSSFFWKNIPFFQKNDFKFEG